MNNFGIYDILIITSGIILLALIGTIKGKGENTSHDFFLASRKNSSSIAILSFIATEISAMTIVGVPAVSFKDNWAYLQFFIGSAISRILIAFLFIPIFYKYNCITIYDFIGKRFSPAVQNTSSIFFLITRIFASGIRLYATALSISVLLGININIVIFLFLIFSYIFISFGGIRSVLYTGVYQALTFYLAGFLLLFFIFKYMDFSFSSFYSISLIENKLKIFNFSLDLKDPNIFLLALLNGIFGSMASFGTDYEMMQKLLTLKTRKESQKTLIYTVMASFFLVIIYLLVGSGIYAFLKYNSIQYTDNSDKIVSYFAVNFLPDGAKGFVFLAIFLASVDLPLVSLSTSFINDIYLKYRKLTDYQIIKLTRSVMIIFALFLGFIAFISQKVKMMLWFAFEINGITSGSLLGIFLLGIFTQTKGEKNIIFSMVFASLLNLTFMILNRLNITSIPWSSFVIIGVVISFFLPQISEKFNLH